MSAVVTVREPVRRRLPGADGELLAVADWPGPQGPLVCVHGLTSNSRVFAGLANELPEHRVVSIDCRGRGESTKKGPFGMSRHAADVAAVLDACGIERATMVGHSMGAYVVGALAAEFPERVERVVFVDGGYFLSYPPGTDIDGLLDTMIGPYLEKFRRTWRDLDEYFAYYDGTAIYPGGVDAYGKAHFAYDLEGDPPEMRAKIDEACVLPDWREVLDHAAVSGRLERVTQPVLLLRAPGGLSGTGDAIVPDDVRDAIVQKVPQTVVREVPECNHHTILCSANGARAVAKAIREFTG